MAAVLTRIIGKQADHVVSQAATTKTLVDGEASEEAAIAEREQVEEAHIWAETTIDNTTKNALVKARKGQGIFRVRLATIEHNCRVTGISNPTHLVASHIKPWRHSNNAERLDGNNGLLLSPNIDHLFDRGFISFADNGDLLVSPIADTQSLKLMGVPADQSVNVGTFSNAQRVFLSFHRSEVFKKADQP